jgi:two-component system NarL family response regulator
MGEIRVLVVDDHALFRSGLVRLLGDYPTLQVVGEAGSADEAVAQSVALQPDVVLMDIDMPERYGIDATSQITQLLPSCRVVMLTIFARNDYLLRAIRAGAHGYVLKDASAEELIGAIHLVAAGGVVVTSRLARHILAEFTDENGGKLVSPHSERLSPRELEVLALIAAGETTRSIAEKLYLSENTIKRHTSNIFQKLHVRHRSQVAFEAIRRGLVPRPDLSS